MGDTNNIPVTYTGYIEKKTRSEYRGGLSIEGVDISPVCGLFFKEKHKYWLWLRRREVTEYDIPTKTFTKRKARPYWECYLQKQENNRIAYQGFFFFMHFKFRIVGIWDRIITDKDRLNLYVERLPLRDQTLIKNINKQKRL